MLIQKKKDRIAPVLLPRVFCFEEPSNPNWGTCAYRLRGNCELARKCNIAVSIYVFLNLSPKSTRRFHKARPSSTDDLSLAFITEIDTCQPHDQIDTLSISPLTGWTALWDSDFWFPNLPSELAATNINLVVELGTLKSRLPVYSAANQTTMRGSISEALTRVKHFFAGSPIILKIMPDCAVDLVGSRALSYFHRICQRHPLP